MISDNGREFDNSKIKEYFEKLKIKHKFSVPFYHQSNGRIERVNRTIRNALKKTPGSVKQKLAKIVENYNNLKHRALGMSPNDALKPENYDKIKKREESYEKEFIKKYGTMETFAENDKVLIRNEIKQTKMDDEFKELGVIIKDEGRNIFTVKKENGSVIRRHASQLRKF